MAAKNLQKRTEILENAYQMISEDSYQGMTFSSLAEKSGISKSLLQSYFPQKQAIVQELLDEMLRESFQYMDSLYPEEGDIFNRLSDYTTLFFMSVEASAKLSSFVDHTIECPELIDLWVEIVYEWLLKLHTPVKLKVSSTHLSACLSFCMYGSLHLLQKRVEYGLSVQEIFENHVRHLMYMLEQSQKRIREVTQHTRQAAETFDTNAFLRYCEAHIEWFEI